MATMLNHNRALRAMITPVSIMVTVTTYFDTHTAAVTIAISMHFAAATITVISIPSHADPKLFGACDGRGSNRNSCQGSKNKRKLLHLGFLSNWISA